MLKFWVHCGFAAKDRSIQTCHGRLSGSCFDQTFASGPEVPEPKQKAYQVCVLNGNDSGLEQEKQAEHKVTLGPKT